MAYPPAPAPVAQPMPVKQGNGFGVTALVLGIIGIVLAVIPFLNIVGIVLGVLALIFGVVALATAGKRNGKGRGTGGAGLVLGVLAVGVAIVINIMVVNAVQDTVDQYYDEYKSQCEAEGLTTAECDQLIEDIENL
ncbi:hypothetical protein LO763_24460 [Glycomyces sp. A-F 0318]|uniref:hypothetical protein n=1 Tax=Glycomyces amatae TaxID=2881355 RepID=UPI001E56C37C|nr:hypothetical protein [Glycomyces amatae]MCD0446776.1 hypothetical protein [Glycomyces amatae]